MATYAELAEHGIAGSAEALPMPVGTEPEPLPVERLAEFEALADAATAGPWCTDDWEIFQGERLTVGAMWIGETCRGTASPEQDRADAAFVAIARTAVPELAAEVRRLLKERHETNQWLSDAAEALREKDARIAELEALTPAAIQTCRTCGAAYTLGEPCSVCLLQVRIDAERAKRGVLDGEHYAATHHDYRNGRDLPGAGGAQ